jgi:hypothetical protein
VLTSSVPVIPRCLSVASATSVASVPACHASMTSSGWVKVRSGGTTLGALGTTGVGTAVTGDGTAAANAPGAAEPASNAALSLFTLTAGMIRPVIPDCEYGV